MSVIYEVMVDWDATDWNATPDFSEGIDDISAYVQNRGIFVDRGKKVEDGNIPAGTVDLTLNNSDKRFSPTYGAGPLFGKIRPWLPVRIRASVSGGGFITFYTGFIERISVDPHPNIQEAYLYCTDGSDLLARNMVSLDKGDRSMVTDGAAVGYLLDGAGWPSSKRSLDTDTGAIVNFPQATEF